MMATVFFNNQTVNYLGIDYHIYFLSSLGYWIDEALITIDRKIKNLIDDLKKLGFNVMNHPTH